MRNRHLAEWRFLLFTMIVTVKDPISRMVYFGGGLAFESAGSAAGGLLFPRRKSNQKRARNQGFLTSFSGRQAGDSVNRILNLELSPLLLRCR